MKLPRRRVEAWLEALDKAAATTERLAAGLGGVTVILHGSYARGDFNVWSDIDLIVVSKRFEGVRVLDRYELISDLLDPGVEVVPMTPGELARQLAKPAWRQAFSRGAVIVRDDYGLAKVIEEAAGLKLTNLRDLRRRVERLLSGSVEV